MIRDCTKKKAQPTARHAQEEIEETDREESFRQIRILHIAKQFVGYNVFVVLSISKTRRGMEKEEQRRSTKGDHQHTAAEENGAKGPKG